MTTQTNARTFRKTDALPRRRRSQGPLKAGRRAGKTVTIAYILQKKYCANTAAAPRLKYGVREKSFFIEDIALRVTPGGPAFTHKGRPLASEADCLAPYYIIDATPRDHLIMSLFQAAAMSGIPCFNSPGLFNLCGDKLAALAFASAQGFTVPATALIDPDVVLQDELARGLEKEFNYPMVLKPRGMLRSFGVLKIEDRGQLISGIQLYARAGIPPLAQEHLDLSEGEYRLYAMGEEPLFLYRRSRAGAGHGHAYAKIPVATLPPACLGLVKKTLRALKPDFMSFDFFKVNGEFILNELEATPGITFITGPDRRLFYRRLHALISDKRAARADAPHG